ncbi:MAG: ion transporter [Xanthomonadaceae bacterium]|nr:ion transporter [Xanthomonadaceae bacterium]
MQPLETGREPLSFRQTLGTWVENPRVQNLIIALIVINAVILGMETSPAIMDRVGPLLITLDSIILGVFVVEIGMKLIAQGPGFFRRGWNLFDFLVVGIALVPASGPLAILRALRILRVLRLLSMLPRLRFVVEALLHSLPGIGSIALLMVVVYYVAAVMATGLFGATHPQWFGDIGSSMYTLFQIMTLESWSMGIVRPVMESHPYAWLFFIPFILIATFTVLNLFIAIIVDAMQTMHEAVVQKEEAVLTEVVHSEGVQIEQELRAVREELRALQDMLRK